jgi:hypothetical protein|tara:strand:+ start:19027 stop:19776 length:750 start_codon:yes stop_codon:yes gene_type:complete
MASITSAELIAYASANMPEDDTSTSGGAIDTAVQVLEFVQSAATVPKIISDDAGDSTGKTVTITGRLANGTIVSDGPTTLNGTTAVSMSQNFERILKVVIAGSPAGTVDIHTSMDVDIVKIPTGITAVRRMFYDSASEAGATTRYEKFFWRNTNGDSRTLNAALITLTADPSASGGTDILIGEEDTATDSATNRETAPSNVTFVDDSVAIDITSLAASSNKGIWVRRDLAASAGPLNTSFTTKLEGTTT